MFYICSIDNAPSAWYNIAMTTDNVTYLGIVVGLIVVLGGVVPALMYRFNINRIKTRYWGKNRKYLKNSLKYNIIVCIIALLYYIIILLTN